MIEHVIPTMLSVADARARLIALAQARGLPGETVALANAHDRIVAIDVIAPLPLPPFANSAMDGFAVRGQDLPMEGRRAFRLIGTRLAGSAAAFNIGEGECLRITTGAAMPDGADTVVIKECAQVDGDDVWIGASESARANVRLAGEDLALGALAVGAGTRINSARLGLLASLGMAQVNVVRRPRVALLTTGDELVRPGLALSVGQIYNSNGYSLASQLFQLGVELVAPETLESEHGECIEIDGSELRLPLLCGEIDGTLMIGPPGNPVSSLATLVALVAPALAAMQGVSLSEQTGWLHVCIDRDWEKRHDRVEFLRARLQSRDDGSLWATPITRQGSGMLAGTEESTKVISVPQSSISI